jgi:hypothetical protein
MKIQNSQISAFLRNSFAHNELQFTINCKLFPKTIASIIAPHCMYCRSLRAQKQSNTSGQVKAEDTRLGLTIDQQELLFPLVVLHEAVSAIVSIVRTRMVSRWSTLALKPLTGLRMHRSTGFMVGWSFEFSGRFISQTSVWVRSSPKALLSNQP